MTKKKKPKYIYPLNYLEDGFKRMPIATRDLVDASNVLLNQKAYAPALSLSIIALEECGKIFILDSLLFLRDKENNYFKKSSISHKDKLVALQFSIPLLLNISKYDKRFKDAKTKRRFETAIRIGLKNLHEQYVELREKMPDSDIRQLDMMKQRGFYTDFYDNRFRTPSEGAEPEITFLANKLANSFIGNIEFIMNKEAVGGYLSFAKKIRGTLSTENWTKISCLLEIQSEETIH